MFTGNEQRIIKDIDAMSITEARKAIAKGQFGSVGRPDREFAEKYLSSKEAEERDKREAETLSIAKEANRIAEDANSLADKANRIALQALSKAKTANILAIIATLIAAIAMYITYLMYIKSP